MLSTLLKGFQLCVTLHGLDAYFFFSVNGNKKWSIESSTITNDLAVKQKINMPMLRKGVGSACSDCLVSSAHDVFSVCLEPARVEFVRGSAKKVRRET